VGPAVMDEVHAGVVHAWATTVCGAAGVRKEGEPAVP